MAFNIKTGCKKKNHPTALSLSYISTPSAFDKKLEVQFCKSKRYHVLMAATHPPASPVEEHHQQSVSMRRKDSLINLLIVPERDKDRYCRRREGEGEGKRQRKLQPAYCIIPYVPAEKVKRRQAMGEADENGCILSLLWFLHILAFEMIRLPCKMAASL